MHTLDYRTRQLEVGDRRQQAVTGTQAENWAEGGMRTSTPFVSPGASGPSEIQTVHGACAVDVVRNDSGCLLRAGSALGRIGAIALMLALLSPLRLEAQAIEDLVRWTGRLTLEESPQSMIVAPRAVADRDGITVTDVREFRVTRFDFTGAAKRRLGGRGGGPGEFESPPLTARHTSAGDVVVAEFGGRLHIMRSGTRGASTTRVPLFPFYDAIALADGHFLLAGWGPIAQRERAERGKLLHVWSEREQRIVRSFFDLPVAVGMLAAARSLGNVSVLVRGDTASATFSLSDTIYHYSVTTGRRLGATAIRSSLLKRASDMPATLSDPSSRATWLENVSVIDALYAIPDGRWLVQFSERFGVVRRYRLLLLGPSGAVERTVAESPQLLAVRTDVRPAQLFFKPSDDEEPNEWRIAVLR